MDVKLNLNDGSFRPYIKRNDKPLYFHRDSNHPKHVAKNIPESVNRRLSALSSIKEMFETVRKTFQEGLDNAGYK